MRRTLVCVAVALCVAVVGCTQTPAPTPTGDTAAPVTQASASPPSPAAPPAPTKAEDAARLKKALVRAEDLGKPWVQPKAVSTVKAKKGEVCPGHVSATKKVPIRAEASANLTEGAGAGKNILTVSLSALPEEDDAALVAAYATDTKACATFRDANGLFVVRSAETPSSAAGADPVATWVERIYYDKQHKKLAYARHYLVVRQGRFVTYVSYAFLAEKKDPSAKDFSRASRLLETQVEKNATTFS